MGIRHILVDLDGVLCDFVGGAIEVHGRTQYRDKIFKNWPYANYDLAGVLDITENELWKKIDLCMAFWEGLRPYPWMRPFLDALDDIAPWTIATSPSRSSRSAGGKVAWLQRHFGTAFRDYVIGPKFVNDDFAPYMKLMARPDVVLIDDCDVNCEAFEKAGGTAILFPQPWNSSFGEAEQGDSASSVIRQLIRVSQSLSLSQKDPDNGKAWKEAEGGEGPQEGDGKVARTGARGQDN